MKNYHTHTFRCLHAMGSEEEYIINAIKGGYSELGFSDHCPWHYESGFIPHMRMQEKEIPDYFQTLLALKEKYKNQIHIKIGFEAEYFEEKMDWLKQVLKDYPVDYLILGHHYDKSDENGCYYGYPLEHKQVKKYVSQVIKGMETGLYSYVAHPDVAYFDTTTPEDLLEMEKICVKAKELDMPLEFNMLGYKTHRHYPCVEFLRLCVKHNNRIIIGIDAHEPGRFLESDLYQEAVKYIHSFGLDITEDISFLR